jgi:hypothetical protein
MKENDFNFISKNASKEDIKLFLGDLDNENETTFKIEDKDIMANLLFKAGVFPSVTQARKNGWNKPIPSGFSSFHAGKNKIRITILNLT